MTPLERIKALGTSRNYLRGAENCCLTPQEVALWELTDELLALWEAMNEPIDDDDHTVQLSLNMENALYRLNTKAFEVVK